MKMKIEKTTKNGEKKVENIHNYQQIQWPQMKKPQFSTINFK